jgi:hypothetical protein
MEAQGSPLAPLLPLQNEVFVASLLLMIPWRSQSHHQTPPIGTQDERRDVSLPMGKGNNHPNPYQHFIAFPRGIWCNLANNYLQEAEFSRLSTKWTISLNIILFQPHKFHPYVLINVPIQGLCKCYCPHLKCSPSTFPQPLFQILPKTHLLQDTFLIIISSNSELWSKFRFTSS